jgi:steroid delta-isomerase-like uncharacterized protein
MRRATVAGIISAYEILPRSREAERRREERSVTTEENKAVARRIYEVVGEFWHTGDADVLDEVIAPDFVHHAPGLPPDLEGFKQVLHMLRAAFPDMRFTVEDLIAEGDKVVDRATWQGTHQGEMMGISPTDNSVTVTEMHVSRIADGKIVERWGQTDMLSMMQQLGAVPPPGQGES